MKNISMRGRSGLSALIFSLLFLLSFSANALAGIDLGWQKMATPKLPPSVEVYKSTLPYPSGSAVRAFYAIIDLNDPNIDIDVAYPGYGGTWATPVDMMKASEEPVYVAANGGFFSDTASVNPVIHDGQVQAWGSQGVTRNGKLYPVTFGAWGMNADRESEIVWTWGSPSDNAFFAFYAPYPNSLLEDPLPVPTLIPSVETAPDGQSIPTGVKWDAVEALGGIQALMKDGEVLDLDETATTSCAADPNITYCNELLSPTGIVGRHPRTAIGVTQDRKKIILLMIDGRSVDSIGATLKETAQIFEGIGAWDALNLDGGGSSTIIANNFDGILEAPASGNGDNSSDVLNWPCDGNMRRVATALLVKRRPLYFDADPDSPDYTETGDVWFPSNNPGAYPDENSPTRLAPTVETDAAPTAQGLFTLNGIVPAEYELGAHWVGASNRATNAPFSIEKKGFDPMVVRMDQTAYTAQFNTVGTFHLSAEDMVRLTNNADNDYVAIDALRLRRVGESIPRISVDGSANLNVITGARVSKTVSIASPNSGVKPVQIKVFKSVDGSDESLFSSQDFTGENLSETYDFSYDVTETKDTKIKFRFEVKDNLNHLASTELEIGVLAFELSFDPAEPITMQVPGEKIEFNINLDTGNPALTMKTLRIFVSDGSGVKRLYREIALSGPSVSVPFSYRVTETAGNALTFTFEAEASDGSSSQAAHTVDLVPVKGDFSIGFVSDMNGGYGSTSYDAAVRNAFAFFVDQGVDAVISGGDMVAGGCSSSCGEDAMWAGFDAQLYGQLKNAGIPFLFTLQNHDAGNAWDVQGAVKFWTNAANKPQGPSLTMVDDTNFPKNYSATLDFDKDGVADVFFVSVFNPGDDLNATELAFMDATLGSQAAQAARIRMVVTGQPLYAVSGPRNSSGYITAPRDEIMEIMGRHNVTLFAAGDSAAYYPGKRFGIQMLSLAEMGGVGKPYLGESQVPPTAVTRADIFKDHPYYGKNAIVFTTYDTRNNFKIVRKEALPTALFGFDNEFVMRNDLPVASDGATVLSSMNLTRPFDSSAKGQASLMVENGRVRVEGNFSGLSSPLLGSFDAAGLYRGRNGQDGKMVQAMDVVTADGKSGSFSAEFDLIPEIIDGLSVGLYYIQINSSSHPQGALRGQFFNAQASHAPVAPAFTTTTEGEPVEIRPIPALLEIEWAKAQDPEKSPVTYIYQLSRTSDFSDLLIDEYVGRQTVYHGLTQAQWMAFLEGLEQTVLFQRIITSDGQNLVVGPAQEIILKSAEGPVTGDITIPTPDFKYQGVFATLGSGFTIYDIAIDETTGRVWANTLYHGPYIFNPDGTPIKLEAPGIGYGIDEYGQPFINSISFRNGSFNDGNCYGVEYDPEGYVLVATDYDLFKLDAHTGTPVAFWNGGSGTSFGVNPSLADDGTIFGHTVYPKSSGFLIKTSETVAGEFDLVRKFNAASPPELDGVFGAVSRSSSYSPEGDRIYLPPTSSSPSVAVYAKENGNWVRKDDFVMPATTGSDAIHAGPNQTMWVVNEKSAFPPNLIYMDFTNRLTWNRYLPEIAESDIRGMTVSRDGKTVYVGGSKAIYKYQIVEGGGVTQPDLIALTQAAAVDASGRALLLDQEVRVQAVVTTANMSVDGLEFYGQDAGDEIKFFAGLDTGDYTARPGDLIEVTGTLNQSLGQIYIQPDIIEVKSSNNPMRPRPLVKAIGEDQESQVVMMTGMTLADAAQWTGTGFLGFEAEIQNSAGDNTVKMFIAKGTDLFAQAAPQGLFSITGVVQQRGDEYVITPLSTQDIALEGMVSISLMDKFLPTSGNRVSFSARASRSLGRISTGDYEWFRNGMKVEADHEYESATGRYYASRNLLEGDRISVRVTSSKSVYPYTSELLGLAVSPAMKPDTTNNAPGREITITFEANPSWAGSIRKITLVDAEERQTLIDLGTQGHVPAEISKTMAEAGVVVPEDQYTVTDTSITFAAGVFSQTGVFTVLVYGQDYRLDQVEQQILAASPEMTVDNDQNDLLNDIEITFPEDEDWNKAVTQVLINGVVLDPADYLLEAGRLIIRSGVFPGVGSQVVTIKAKGFTDRVFEQSIVLSTPPALSPDSSNNQAGQAVEITFPSNPIWQGFVTQILVNDRVLDASEYVLSDGGLTLAAGLLSQIRDYRVVVRADNFTDATVIQPILAAPAPGLTAASSNNSIFDNIVITFLDDPVWRSNLVWVSVNNTMLGADQFSLTEGRLEIDSANFPERGEYLIQVSAGMEYQVASVTQTVTAPVYTVSGTVTVDGQPSSNTKVFFAKVNAEQRLEMGFDGTLEDASGNSFTPVPDNVPVYLDDNERSSQVLEFNGVNDLVNIQDFVLEGDYTVSVWINPDVTAGSQGGWSRSFMAYFQNAENAFRLAMDSSILRASVITNGSVVGRQTGSAFALTPGQWVHVTVVVKHGTSAALYVNGVDAGSEANSWSRGTNPGLTLGCRHRGAAHYDGKMDDLTIWNKALTAEEVASLTKAKGTKIVTDDQGRYGIQAVYGKNLTLYPVSQDVVFTPEIAEFSNIAADITQDFAGSSAGTSATNGQPETPVTPVSVPGDLNMDGRVDMDDMNLLKAHLRKPAAEFPQGDLNDDGKINVLDARKLIRMCDCPRCRCN